jgi:DnaK suppressor protein
MNFKEDENYINDDHLEYFKNKILKLKQNILENQRKENEITFKKDIDFMDVVATQIERNIEIKEQEHHYRTLQSIEKALRRIEDKTYGYCEKTGEPIDLNRLEANPLAILSIEAQTFYENMKKTHI